MSHIINVNFIGVLKEQNGRLVYDEVSIPRNEELFKDLNLIREQNGSCIQLQERILQEYENESKYRYSFCYPYSYSLPYIDDADRIMIPQIDKTKYEEQIKKIRENSAKQRQNTETAISECVKKEADKYYNSIVKYCTAHDYYKQLSHLQKDPKIKMISSERRGITSNDYKINEEIKVSINTNFGYGYSSYFCELVTYKGEPIIPYSQLVIYYYADVVELIKCTYSYEVDRTSWNIALQNTANIVNMATYQPEEFVNKWISNEMTILMSELHKLNETPQKSLEIFLSKPRKNASNYIGVRNMEDEEKEEYKARPQEFLFLLKATKISNALKFLSNMEKFASLNNIITKGINEILQLNYKLYPELRIHLDSAVKEEYYFKNLLNIEQRKYNKINHNYTNWNIYKNEVELILRDHKLRLGNIKTNELQNLQKQEKRTLLTYAHHLEKLIDNICNYKLEDIEITSFNQYKGEQYLLLSIEQSDNLENGVKKILQNHQTKLKELHKEHYRCSSYVNQLEKCKQLIYPYYRIFNLNKNKNKNKKIS